MLIMNDSKIGKRMLLVNSADADDGTSDGGVGDFLNSLDGAGTKVEQESTEESDNYEETEDDSSEETDDETTEMDLDDDTEGSTEEETTELVDPRDHMLKQQQEIIDKLMAKVEKLGQKEEESDKSDESDTDIDPFESQEFQGMAEVMNWDADETAAFKTFFSKYMADNAERMTQKLMQTVPQKVSASVTEQQRIQTARDQFYEANPELASVKPYVAELARSVAAELGEKATIETVLAEVGKRAYKTLGLTKMKQKTSGKKKPAFAGAKGARQKKVEVDPKQKEIDAVIGIL